MAALENSTNIPQSNRFAHAEAQARRRASSKESRGSDTGVLKKILSGDGTRSRGTSNASEGDAGARARANWRKAGISVKAMLRFAKGSQQKDQSAGDVSAIPDRFAAGIAAAKRKSLEQQGLSNKPSVIKSVTGGTRSRGNSAESDARASF